MRRLRLRPVADLPPSAYPSYAMLGWTDHDPPIDPRTLGRLRRAGLPLAPYLGYAAVEEGAVVAQVMVEHRTWTTESGPSTFAAISNVVTRHDAVGRGLCRRLFAEVHRRERLDGRRLAMLWTRRTWSAHRLYERLGYRDVYGHTLALRRPPRPIGGSRGSSPRPRAARASDAGTLERLLAEATRDRLGFVPRYPRSFRLRFRLGWRSPGEHHLLSRGGRPTAFFVAATGPDHVTVTEAIVGRAGDGSELLDAIERFAAGRWLAFGHSTFVDDLAPEFAERGYDRLRGSHATLMARSLSGPPSARLAEVERTVRDPKFWCQRGDMF